MRDFQRSKVYDSERSDSQCEFITLEESKKLVKRILKMKRVRKLYPSAPKSLEIFVDKKLVIHDGAADYNHRRINVKDGPITKETIVHEVAHFLARGDEHGRKFCAALLKLTTWVFGRERSNELKEEFKKRNVKYKSKRVSNISLAKKLELSLKMKKYWAQKKKQ